MGGVQVVFRDLVHWLEQTGRHVPLVSTGTSAASEMRAGSIRGAIRFSPCRCPAIIRRSGAMSVPIFLVYLPITLFHLVRLMWIKKIDVINCHCLAPYFIHLVVAARLLRVAVVISVHGADIDDYTTSTPADRLLLRMIMRGAHRIVACSAALARQTIDVFPDVRGKVTYVHNGLDLAHYGDSAGARCHRLSCCASAGTFTRRASIRCCMRSCRWGVSAPTLSLVLVGDGPLFEDHKELARNLQIDNRLVFIGSTPHAEVGCPFPRLHALRAAVQGRAIRPRHPGGGLLYRKALVCTSVGGVPEIVTDGVSGVLVEADNFKGMAEASLRS